MHRSLLSLASALTLGSIVSITSAAVVGQALSPRNAEDELDRRFVCLEDTYYEVFASVGMSNVSDAAENDIDDFCRYWIDLPYATSYFRTVTPTTTLYPATVTDESTTGLVLSPTSTVTVTTAQTEFALYKRSHVRKDKVQERAPAAVITPRAELSKKMILHARQVASSATKSLDIIALGSALSSACSCKMIQPVTTYLTFTATPATRTIGATDYRTVTLNSTIAGGVTTVTETVNVTSTIRPTGTGQVSSGIMPTHSSNYTMRSTGTHSYPHHSHSSMNRTRTLPSISHGTGTSGWPHPTKNSTCLPCSTASIGYRNITATITAFSTAFSTATEFSTITDVVSAIIVKNLTVTITEGSVTVTGSGTTITETVTLAGSTETTTATISATSLRARFRSGRH